MTCRLRQSDSRSLLDIVLRRKELELILEKTCGWFRIDCKPNFYVAPPPLRQIQEFTYDEDKLQMMGMTGQHQKKSRKTLSPEEKELQDAIMAEISRSLQELLDSRKYNQGDQDDGIDLAANGKLIQEPEFLMDEEQYDKFQEKRAKRMQEFLELEYQRLTCCINRESREPQYKPLFDFKSPAELFGYFEADVLHEKRAQLKYLVAQTDIRTFFKQKVMKLIETDPSIRGYEE